MTIIQQADNIRQDEFVYLWARSHRHRDWQLPGSHRLLGKNHMPCILAGEQLWEGLAALGWIWSQKSDAPKSSFGCELLLHIPVVLYGRPCKWQWNWTCKLQHLQPIVKPLGNTCFSPVTGDCQGHQLVSRPVGWFCKGIWASTALNPFNFSFIHLVVLTCWRK